jgi:hypothetical protein
LQHQTHDLNSLTAALKKWMQVFLKLETLAQTLAQTLVRRTPTTAVKND